MIGNRLMAEEGAGNCTKDEGSALWHTFCKYQEVLVEGLYGENRTSRVAHCDPYFEKNNVSRIPGIRGLASGVILGKPLASIRHRSASIVFDCGTERLQ